MLILFLVLLAHPKYGAFSLKSVSVSFENVSETVAFLNNELGGGGGVGGSRKCSEAEFKEKHGVWDPI